MAAKKLSRFPCHMNCIKHSRFTKQNGWLLLDLSLSLCGNIAVTGYNENTDRTSIDVYSPVRNADKPKMIYSKEFVYEDEERIYKARYVNSFVDDEVLVSCHGNKLKVFQVSKDEVLRSRTVNGWASCLSVKEREIFIGFKKSNKITVYNVADLNEIKSIILQGLQDGCTPYDMTAAADRLFVSEGKDSEESYSRPLIFDEKNGKMVSELTKPTDTRWYTTSVTVCVPLGVVAAVWRGERRRIVFYSLLSKSKSSFLLVEAESGVDRIRISDRGDRMVTGNWRTGEVKVYDVAELFTYSHFKGNLAATLHTDDCIRLADLFRVSKDQRDVILNSDKPSENLLLALEEKGVLQPYNIDRLIGAFTELEFDPFCHNVSEIYQKTRVTAFYKGIREKHSTEMKTLQTTYEKESRQLKEKKVEIRDLHKALQTMLEVHQKMTQDHNRLKAEHDESQIQLSTVREELQLSQKSKLDIERVLQQTKELLQEVRNEKNKTKAELKQWQIQHSLETVTLEERRKPQAEKTKSGASASGSTYLSESVLADEFSKVIVKVSAKLTRTNCVFLATYFNFPPSRIATIKEESNMPGLDLFDTLKERNSINMYDVNNLQQALVDLELHEINETIVTPYQRNLDPRLHEQHAIRPQDQ